MRILIIGSGGREHALAWKLRQRNDVEALFIAPGNAGTREEGTNVPLAVDDVPGLVAFALRERIDLVIPGPELPLTLGVVDAMLAAGVPCFGPSGWCARLEGSKAFAKELMKAAGVPTAPCGVFTELSAAKAFVHDNGAPIVIKADGLAAGKGVVVARTEAEALDALEQIMGRREFGTAGDTVVIEAFLQGEEVSLLAFCDGETALPLPSAQDHKAVFNGDAGPNTGGMGAYSPAPILPDKNLEAMADLAIRPILREMQRQGHPFKGILYAGLMITGAGPMVLEYNVRFGDPECQPQLMRLESDLVELMHCCINGTLAETRLAVRPEAAVGVVIAAKGYPGEYARGMAIEGLAEADALPGCKVFQAGTTYADGAVRANGGRILCVTALGDQLAAAKARAYEAVACVHMDKGHHRTDIADKGLKRLAKQQAAQPFTKRSAS